MSPLGGPDGQYGSGLPQPEKRQPWELLFDVILLSGAAVLVWNALIVAGLFPGSTVLINPAWGTTQPRFDDVLFIWALALVGVAEYVPFLMIANGKRTGVTDGKLLPIALRVKIEAFLTAMVWIYLAVLYFVTPKGV